MEPRILAEYTAGNCVLQAVFGDMTAVRFTAFDGPTANLFAVAVRNQATFMPESSF